jgi:hypothetical protein
MAFLIPYDRGVVAQPHNATIAGQHAVLQLELAALGGSHLSGHHAFAILRMEYLLPIVGIFLEGVRRLTEHSLYLGAIVEGGLGLDVLDVDGGRDILDQGAIPELGLFGPHLRLLALGYLADDGEYQVPAVLRVMAQAYGAERYLDRDLLVRFQASLGEQIIWRAVTTG